MAKLPDLETWAKEAGERGAQYALKYLEEEYGVSIRRLIELAQADREGRCVVLPAKIGDSIYFTFLGKIIEKQVFSVVTFCNSQRIYCDGTSLFFRPDDIGRTVFLTSEDAEEAMKGECKK